MHDFERQVLRKILCGNYAPLVDLSKTIDNLQVITRDRQPYKYIVAFQSPITTSVGPRHGSINLGIGDTMCLLNESTELVEAKLVAIDGSIRWLSLEGSFDFRNQFSVAELFWVYRDANNQLTKTEQRDFKFGFWDPTVYER